MTKPDKIGLAGTIANIFIRSKLTPVIAVASILLGVMAVILTPKEEEPQISVPMIDIITPAPGFEAKEVEREVTEPIERAIWGLDGIDYVYSASRAHESLVTARFKVGEPMEPSLVKIHHKIMEIADQLPPGSKPEVKSYSIDDVPFLILTFSSKNRDPYSLRTLVAPLARELSSTPDLSRVDVLGGEKRAIRVIVDPAKLAARGATLLDVAQALKANDSFGPVGKTWGEKEVYDVDAGGIIKNVADIESISIGQKGGVPLRIKDVAQVVDGPEEMTRASFLIDKKSGLPQEAVSIDFAKRNGTNVVALSAELISRARTFSAQLPKDIQMSVVRNYGKTAAQKSKELIEHLLLATLSVAALIALAMGIRASLVVAVAIPVTLALTLAIYYFMGYTLNRVTLFALIFSIGILVDDAIVVVENIERHLKVRGNDVDNAAAHGDAAKKNIISATIKAVSEVGNPTILATFTVIAAILPMAFVRGLMGPYMKPIPVGASLAMILSLLVAFIVTPWASVKLLTKKHGHDHGKSESKLDKLYRRAMQSLLKKKSHALTFGAITVALFICAVSLLYFKTVKVKMLPFDNKDEFQVLVDYPPTTPLAKNIAYTKLLAEELIKNKDVSKVQIFSGEPAPYTFSGMVKHTFLRGSDYQSDLQVVLTDKDKRKISSHRIIQNLRPLIAQFGRDHNAITKALEIPPGPPVLATMVAEIYGPDKKTRDKVAQDVYDVFRAEPSVVDLDSSWRPGRPREQYFLDPVRAGLLGINAQQLEAVSTPLFSEDPILTLHDVSSPEDVDVDLSVQQSARSNGLPYQNEHVPSFEAGVSSVSRSLKPVKTIDTTTLYRKNLKPVDYVMSELSGSEEAPVYGILKMAPKIHYKTQTADVPWNTLKPVVKWDGEWFITYQVFRDLGIAFAVVMLLIYVLVLGWFRSYAVPLVIMAPIPISLIGILPGHALVGAYFTATSMIGFIAGAGIIVRNSIILVDFIEHQLGLGMDLKDAVVSAGVLRFRPMLLTAAAVVVGSSVMLADPIFQGLAVSLIFGEVAATVLSRFAVPVLYYWFIGKSRVRFLKTQAEEDESYVHSTQSSSLRGELYSH